MASGKADAGFGGNDVSPALLQARGAGEHSDPCTTLPGCLASELEEAVAEAESLPEASCAAAREASSSSELPPSRAAALEQVSSGGGGDLEAQAAPSRTLRKDEEHQAKIAWHDNSEESGYCCLGWAIICCPIVFAVLLIVLVPAAIVQLGQQRYGLVINTVDNTMPLDRVYTPGRYWIGPGHRFTEYWSTIYELDFTDNSGGSLQIRDRNGKQARLNITVQFRLIQDEIPQLWRERAFHFTSVISALVRESIIRGGNDLVISDFWTAASATRKKLFAACEAAMVGQHASCWALQVLGIKLDAGFDSSLTKTQVTKQSQKTEQARLKAANLRATTQAMLANLTANITVINATGQAQMYKITAAAEAAAAARRVQAEQSSFDLVQNWLVVKRTGEKLSLDRFKEYQRLLQLQEQQDSFLVYSWYKGSKAVLS